MSKASTSLLRPIDAEQALRSASTVETTLALLFHTRRGGELVLVTTHAVAGARGQPQIGPGNALTPEDEARIVALIQGREAGDQAALEILPDGLLVAKPALTAWFVPGALRPMYFRNEKGAFELSVDWPSLVLAATANGLHVVALADATRPTTATPLFVAPLANVWENSRVCTGTARVPNGWAASDIPAWNAVLFDTAFTHANADVLRGVAGRGLLPIQSFWRARARRNQPLAAKDLLPAGLTLGQWLARRLTEQR